VMRVSRQLLDLDFIYFTQESATGSTEMVFKNRSILCCQRFRSLDANKLCPARSILLTFADKSAIRDSALSDCTELTAFFDDNYGISVSKFKPYLGL
jgi:hypothetical protein